MSRRAATRSGGAASRDRRDRREGSRYRRPRWVLLAAGVAFLAVTATALAHERSVSYAGVLIRQDGASVTLRLSSRDLTRLPESAASGPSGVAALSGAGEAAVAEASGAAAAAAGESAVAEAVAGAVLARRGGEACAVAASPRVTTLDGGGARLLEWDLRCPRAGRFEVESRLPRLLGVPHLCFVRIDSPGRPVVEVVLHDEAATWSQDSARQGPGGFFLLGLEHIAAGVDHLLFVLALVLVAASLAELAVVITAFTAAHALTLGAAVLGLLRPAAAPVEALIAASIALLAVENLTLRAGALPAGRRHPVAAAAFVLAPALVAAAAGLGRVPLMPLAGTGLFVLCYLVFAGRRPGDRRVRWLVAFTFGLLHGFGFAGALVGAGFSGATVATALLAFHAGVEAGQLLFVAAAWPLILLLRRWTAGAWPALVLEPAAAALLATAVGWYTTRAFG